MNESTGKIKLNLKLSKDLNNELWSVKKAEGTPGGAIKKRKTDNIAAGKSAPNTKQSIKVSLPIERYRSVMRNRKDSALKTQDLSRIETPRPPPPLPTSGQLMRPPAPSNTTSLRMVRHPVPTSKVRTTMAERFEKIVKSSLTNAPVQNYVAESRITPVIPYSGATEVFSAKHKLPFVIPWSKNSSVISNPVSKDNHLNNCCTVPQKTITAVAASQTEGIFIVTEQDFRTLQRVKAKNIIESDIQILDAVKDSGVTKEELQKQLHRIKKRRESNNDSECIVIDLESESEKRSEKDDNTLSKVIRQSEQNKNYLLTLRSWLSLPNGPFTATSAQPVPQTSTLSSKTVASGELPSSMSAAPTVAVESIHHDTYPKDCDQIATAATSKTPNNFSSFRNIIECDDLSNSPITRIPTRIASDEIPGSLAITPNAILTPSPEIATPNPPVLAGFVDNLTTAMENTRIKSDSVEPILISREDSSTQTEDENNNNKIPTPDHHRDNGISRYEQNNIQNLSTVSARPVGQEQQQNEPTPHPQELPMFQTPQIPVQIQQPQTQRYVVPMHHERLCAPPPRSRKMQQHRNQYAQMRQQFPYPYEQNRPRVAPTTPQIQRHIPPVQLYSNNPWQYLPDHIPYGGFPRLSRVLSTDEANLRGHAVQTGRNYHFPVYYDTHGNRWSRRPPGHRNFN